MPVGLDLQGLINYDFSHFQVVYRRQIKTVLICFYQLEKLVSHAIFTLVSEWCNEVQSLRVILKHGYSNESLGALLSCGDVHYGSEFWVYTWKLLRSTLYYPAHGDSKYWVCVKLGALNESIKVKHLKYHEPCECSGLDDAQINCSEIRFVAWSLVIEMHVPDVTLRVQTKLQGWQYGKGQKFGPIFQLVQLASFMQRQSHNEKKRNGS